MMPHLCHHMNVSLCLFLPYQPYTQTVSFGVNRFPEDRWPPKHRIIYVWGGWFKEACPPLNPPPRPPWRGAGPHPANRTRISVVYKSHSGDGALVAAWHLKRYEKQYPARPWALSSLGIFSQMQVLVFRKLMCTKKTHVSV